MIQTAITKLQLSPDPLPKAALIQVRLPLKEGGLGLRSTVGIAPAAYLGSLASAAPAIISSPTGIQNVSSLTQLPPPSLLPAAPGPA